MENGAATLDKFTAEVGVAHVTRHDFERCVALGAIADHVFKPPPVVEGIIVGEGADTESARKQGLDKMGAYETIGTRHGHSLVYINHLLPGFA